jgi:uncharacterized membrane protein HdeD (DUF308 family)
MGKNQRIVGMIMSVVGLFLIGLSFFVKEASWVALLYGVPLLIVGIIIFLNKKEDVIEQVKGQENKNGGK